MDFWEYTLKDDNTYGLNDSKSLKEDCTSPTSGYIADEDKDGNIDIENGKIKGTIPQYISTDNGKNFIKVTDLSQTFRNLRDLQVMPKIPKTIILLIGTFCDTDIMQVTEIPSGVINMNGTFGRCYNLENAPSIPDTVIDMTSTFYQCRKLKQIPKISNNATELGYTFNECSSITEVCDLPDNIINMYGTFCGCSSIKKVTKLPLNVVNMKSTFYGCTNLIEVPDIPENVEDLERTFGKCTNLKKTPNISKSTKNMICTFSGCSSLDKAPDIPNGVKQMHGTFENCSSLVTPPKLIPSSVSDMSFTFYACFKLQGEMQINADIQGKDIVISNVSFLDYSSCFNNACTDGDGLLITNTSLTDKVFLKKLVNNNTKIEIQE